MVGYKSINHRTGQGNTTTDILSGSLDVTGLVDVFKSLASRELAQRRSSFFSQEIVDQHSSPLLADGRWQMEFLISSKGHINVRFLAKSIPGESESPSDDGYLPGLHEVTLSFVAAGVTSNPIKLDRQRWKPYEKPEDAVCIEKWISNANPTGWIIRSPLDIITVNWSIETSSKEVTWTPGSPFGQIVEELFDDENASDVVFIITHPRRHSQHEEYIYAHTKILSVRSEFFKTMFQSNFSEGATSSSSDISKKELGADELMYFCDSDYEDDEPTEAATTSEVQDQSTRKGVSPKSNRREVGVGGTSHSNSYKTYRAMLYFLYTGSYSFCPPTSSYKTQDLYSTRKKYNAANACIVSPYGFTGVPSSSAKSMYRLCHRLGIPDLKRAALEYIKSSLTPENILAEFCSTLTLNFDEVLQIEQEYLISHWTEIKHSPEFRNFILKLFEEQHSELMGNAWVDVLLKLPVS